MRRLNMAVKLSIYSIRTISHNNSVMNDRVTVVHPETETGG